MSDREYDVLYRQYQLYSDEELNEIINSDEQYTDTAKQAATDVLHSDREVYKQHLKEQEEKQNIDDVPSNDNTVGGILKAIGILILIFGSIGSFVYGSSGYEFAWGIFLIMEVAVIISGMLIMGIGEIILLLTAIKNKK